MARTSLIATLKNVNHDFITLTESRATSDFPEVYNHVVSQMHHLTAAAYTARQAGMTTEEIRQELAHAWDIFSASSFVRHLQTWPRGYPGDFEAINMIIDRNESTSLDSVGGMIGTYCLNTTIAQQHREKIAIQATLLRQTCEQRKNPRIASIACGASRDIEQVQHDIAIAGAELLLIDFDQAALDESARRLTAISDRVRFQLTNVRRIPKLLAEGVGFDLIYAGGLFDYLPESITTTILKHAGQQILPGGCLMFTNAANNPLYHSYKPFIETMADWHLIDRTREEMELLLSASGCLSHRLELEPTGLMWIAKGYF